MASARMSRAWSGKSLALHAHALRRPAQVPRSRPLIGLLLLGIAGIGLGTWYSQDPTELPSGTTLHRRVRVAVPPGGRRVTFALRAPDSSTRWYATSEVQRNGPRQTGFALFETWMGLGSYEAIAVTPEGYEARATLHYLGGADQVGGMDPSVMRVVPR